MPLAAASQRAPQEPIATSPYEVMEQLVDAFNERDRERFDAGYGPEVVAHASSGETRTMNQDEHWEEVLEMLKVFPNPHARVDDMISDGDRLFLRVAHTGTHQGPRTRATSNRQGVWLRGHGGGSTGSRMAPSCFSWLTPS